jgi:hypothetical protein
VEDGGPRRSTEVGGRWQSTQQPKIGDNKIDKMKYLSTLINNTITTKFRVSARRLGFPLHRRCSALSVAWLVVNLPPVAVVVLSSLLSFPTDSLRYFLLIDV